MPATTPSPAKARGDENGKFKFVKCDLDAAQKADLKRWIEIDATPEALLAYLERRVVGEHTLGLKSQEVGYMATLTGVREQSGHVNISLTARASTAGKALYALQYKDEIALKGHWEVADWANELDV